MADTGDDLWNRAQALHLDNKFVEAEEIYCTLLEQNHNNAGLLATLGSLYLQVQRHGLAIHFLEGALKQGLGQSDVHTNLGLAYNQSGQRNKAREHFEISISQNPTPEALANYSALFIEAGENKKCVELCERAIKGNNELALAHWNLSLSLLSDGIWERGWDEYDWGLKAIKCREDRKTLDVPIWDGTHGKTVLIYGEQGLGDEIMFTSMLPDILKTNPVVYECHKRLETLFKKSFDIPIYGTRESKEESPWTKDHKIDYRLPIGSLGRFYRRSRESFPGTPYLKADPLPKTKFRVGISWMGGGAKMGRVIKRSIPLPLWKTILNVTNVEFVSLQYTDCKEELDLMDTLGYPVKVMDEYAKNEDYHETARLVASCDLVISVCTSVVHLAGALGVPCWVAAPKWPAWRYQNEGGMPFYKSVRLYRQPEAKAEMWHHVLARIGLDLEDLVNGKAQKVA